MYAKLIGKIEFDQSLLKDDLDVISSFSFNPIYSEYTRGTPGWQTCVLFNKDGDEDEAYFQSYKGHGQPTSMGRQLGYLMPLLLEVFDETHLKWIRIFSVQNGFVMPHRDYLDVAKKNSRLHIPINTDDSCLNSEDNYVYHMNIGEIWFLDAAKTHSACSLSSTRRLHLGLDFDGEIPLQDLFKKRSFFRTDLSPQIVPRDPIDNDFLQSIYGLSNLIHEANFDDISTLLCKLHFVNQVGCSDAYKWLREIAERTGNPTLIKRSAQMTQLFLGT